LPEKSKELANLARIAEYGGQFDADATLLGNLINAAEAVRVALAALPALPDK